MKKFAAIALLFSIYLIPIHAMKELMLYEYQTVSKVYNFIIDYKTPLVIDLSESESDVKIVSEPIAWEKSSLIPQSLYKTKCYEYISSKAYNLYHTLASLLIKTAHKNKRSIRAEAYYARHTSYLADQKDEFSFTFKENYLSIKPLIHKRQSFFFIVPSDSPLIVKAKKNINYITCYGTISTQEKESHDHDYCTQKDDVVKNISHAQYDPPSVDLYTKNGTITVRKVSKKELDNRLKK